jgi:hypothetical protein
MTQKTCIRVPERDQLINQSTHQGRPRESALLCKGCRALLSASALAGVAGYQLNHIPRGGRSICRFARQRPAMSSLRGETRRTEYPPCQFIAQRIKYLERGVTKP